MPHWCRQCLSQKNFSSWWFWPVFCCRLCAWNKFVCLVGFDPKECDRSPCVLHIHPSQYWRRAYESHPIRLREGGCVRWPFQKERSCRCVDHRCCGRQIRFLLMHRGRVRWIDRHRLQGLKRVRALCRAPNRIGQFLGRFYWSHRLFLSLGLKLFGAPSGFALGAHRRHQWAGVRHRPSSSLVQLQLQSQRAQECRLCWWCSVGCLWDWSIESPYFLPWWWFLFLSLNPLSPSCVLRLIDCLGRYRSVLIGSQPRWFSRDPRGQWWQYFWLIRHSFNFHWVVFKLFKWTNFPSWQALWWII